MNILFLEFMFMFLSGLTETFSLGLDTEHFAVWSEFTFINNTLILFDIKFVTFLDFLRKKFKILFKLSCKIFISFTNLSILLGLFNVINFLQVSHNPTSNSLSIQFSIYIFFCYLIQLLQLFM